MRYSSEKKEWLKNSLFLFDLRRIFVQMNEARMVRNTRILKTYVCIHDLRGKTRNQTSKSANIEQTRMCKFNLSEIKLPFYITLL